MLPSYIELHLQVDGLCKLLNQNSESLASLEFFHCKLSPAAIDKICGSLLIKGLHIHGIQHFSINTVSLLEKNPVSLPPGLVSFLSSGRYNSYSKFKILLIINLLYDMWLLG